MRARSRRPPPRRPRGIVRDASPVPVEDAPHADTSCPLPGLAHQRWRQGTTSRARPAGRSSTDTGPLRDGQPCPPHASPTRCLRFGSRWFDAGRSPGPGLVAFFCTAPSERVIAPAHRRMCAGLTLVTSGSATRVTRPQATAATPSRHRRVPGRKALTVTTLDWSYRRRGVVGRPGRPRAGRTGGAVSAGPVTSSMRRSAVASGD